MKTNIVLIGFMGTGKTTVGKILAEKLNKKLIEMDDLIVQKAKKSIPEIFSEDGENAFREYEMSVAKDLSKAENCIISAGGGVILNKLNIDYLKISSHIVLLQATAKDIYLRILEEGKEKRPLLNKPDPMKEIKNLLSFRKPFYEAAAEIKISTFRKTPEQVADEIILELDETKQINKSNSDLGSAFSKLSDVLFENSETDEKSNEIDSNVDVFDNKIKGMDSKIDATAEEKQEFALSKKSAFEAKWLTDLSATCTDYKGLNSLELYKKIIAIASTEDFPINYETPLSYTIVPSVILTIFRNYQASAGPIDISLTPPPLNPAESKTKLTFKTIKTSDIILSMKRALLIPYGSYGYFGISGHVLGAGVAFSILTQATPVLKDRAKFVNSIVLNVFSDIAKKSLLDSSNEELVIESILLSVLKICNEKLKMKLIQ